MIKIDKFKGQRNVERSKKYNESFVDGGKVCTGCSKTLPLEQYNKRQGGLQARCRPCMQIYNKKRWKKAKYKLW